MATFPNFTGTVLLMGAHDEFFARMVRERRQQLGNLTMPEVHQRGGPAVPAQQRADRCELSANVRPSTFAKFDTGLGWQEGSARAAYYDRRPPVPVESDTPAFEPGASSISLSLEQLLPLLDAQRFLRTAPIAELPNAIGKLDDAISGIVGPFVTSVLEANRGTQVHPLVEIAFGESLAAPVSPDDPDATEKLYRRWLIGRAEDLDDALQQAFEQRFQKRNQDAATTSRAVAPN
ncbi:hypothetical protein LTT66_21335 [Nocardia gipuzkoensis]|uniref:Uncharacterized protein n=5 Tax=Nocardiaceae TaxID=85025 RepID=A0A7G1KG49_9NOCA|nr:MULTISPECIES: hypothetical protein [Nocardia]MCP2287107.1 hypothetical protein [Nocardia amikacinitolerans]RBO84449.1 hypothetical protein DFR74_11610 [Nocardia puris]BCK53911.1 hypothetical protein NWFMUON74_16830 [Nocardia wallacei]MBF6451965.1 hypothetical protein [Nocardia cyriacigeorgica]MBF6477115.1 hypothetical protein [Nocardia cyriacigeorgica]